MIQRKLSISHSVFLTFKAEKKKTEKMYQNSEMPSAKEKKNRLLHLYWNNAVYVTLFPQCPATVAIVFLNKTLIHMG